MGSPDGFAGGQDTVSHSIDSPVDTVVKYLEAGKQPLEQDYPDDDIFIKFVKPVFPVEQGIQRFEHTTDSFR